MDEIDEGKLHGYLMVTPVLGSSPIGGLPCSSHAENCR
jgi:hypothetical protein